MDGTQKAGPSGTEYKTRRPHTKSRYGCSKCKERRIKCDEITPQCSRCKKMKLNCQYPRHPEGSSQGGNARSPESNHSDQSSSAVGGSPSSSLSSATTAHSLLALPSYSRARSSSHSSQIDLPLRSEVAQRLAPTEFELLKHFLEHTSRDPTVDPDDQYTLQIGIPNLAIQCRPLMKSVLALAAVCRCSDIINQYPGPQGCDDARGQVVELLSLANQYHMDSLREIQTALPEAKQYDNVLANAAMMGMYGSASHNTRIWLARTATFADQRLGDSVPKLPQWISLFRAVHLAYVGLLNNRLGTGDLLGHSPARSPISPLASTNMQYEYNISSRGGGETMQPRGTPLNHPLYPILAATVSSAMVKLHDKAREIAIIHDSSPLTTFYDLEPTPPQNSADLQACYSALAIFNDIVADTFRAGDSTPVSHGGPNNLALDVDIEPMGQLSEVSPWLRRYTASITSMVPSRLSRRIIMAFIHKVPTRYLSLVEETMTILQTDPQPPSVADDMAGVWGLPPLTPEPSIAHQLAMEIFAHWLVLVILLDNVWWIGGVGAWELGRIVASRNEVRWRNCLFSKDDDWWPESMFEVSRQFDKHRA